MINHKIVLPFVTTIITVRLLKRFRYLNPIEIRITMSCFSSNSVAPVLIIFRFIYRGAVCTD